VDEQTAFAVPSVLFLVSHLGLCLVDRGTRANRSGFNQSVAGTLKAAALTDVGYSIIKGIPGTQNASWESSFPFPAWGAGNVSPHPTSPFFILLY
jgi:hypothetical protein